MRLTLFFLLNILLCFAMELFLPWWSIIISSGILAMVLFPKYIAMLLLSFIGIFIYWSVVAFYLSSHNHHLLLEKMAHLWGFDNFIFMPLIFTGCVGGIASLVGASMGYWMRYSYLYNRKLKTLSKQ